MLKRLSPQALMAICTSLCLFVACTVIVLALQTPWTGLTFTALDDNRIGISRMHPDSPNRDYSGLSLQGFMANNEFIPASPHLLYEEPDVLPDYQDYNRLMQWQTQLTEAALANTLRIVTDEEDILPLLATARPWDSLPALFWLQLFFGIGGALTGALVWSTRRYDTAACLYALTGLGYLIFAPAAAIYSTRELIIDGSIFRNLSVINHFGALFFTASLTSLLWCYPHKLARTGLISLVFASTAIIWLLDSLQWLSPLLFHLGVLGVFSLSFIFAFFQWRHTRQDPLGRAALRWFLLSIYLATGLFAAVIILPAALNLPQPASQGVMFGAFLIMYWGLALGIVRYRLFSLDQWWHSIMVWFIGGLCVVALDIVLIAVLALPGDIALSLAVALTGWLYFPLRQWFWHRPGKNRPLAIRDWLPDVLPLLIRKDTHLANRQMRQQTWQQTLGKVWRAADVSLIAAPLEVPVIMDEGLTLAVPDIHAHADCHYRIHCPDKGQRLFHKQDIQLFFNLREMISLVLESIDARNQGMQEERERIRRDIHDDIGSRLLTLLHTAPENLQSLIRETLRDTRALVQTLDQQPADTATACAVWRREAEQRCTAAQVELDWDYQQHALPSVLPTRVHINITRILREAISNALKHGSPSRISVHFFRQADESFMVVHDNGQGSAADEVLRPGNGLRIMQERAREIGGHMQWQAEAKGFSIHLGVELHNPVTP